MANETATAHQEDMPQGLGKNGAVTAENQIKLHTQVAVANSSVAVVSREIKIKIKNRKKKYREKNRK